MIRSAAKNHERVAVVVDPADYGRVLADLERDGEISAALRFRAGLQGVRAYRRLRRGHRFVPRPLPAPEAAPAEFPRSMHLSATLARPLRYGENPHQKAAFYALSPGAPGLSLPAEVIQGKELRTTTSWTSTPPCGWGRSSLRRRWPSSSTPTLAAWPWPRALAAYRLARETDPVSAFGGIVAVNREVDGQLGREMSETFLECVIAPSYTPEALAALAGKKNLRLLPTTSPLGPRAPRRRSSCAVSLADFWSRRANRYLAAAAAKVVTKRAPTAAELADLDFAWRVAKHVKSNAIVFAGGGRTLGVGAGQMSRVDSVRIAVSKARGPLAGSVLASDAFFPFRDGVDEAAKAGP